MHLPIKKIEYISPPNSTTNLMYRQFQQFLLFCLAVPEVCISFYVVTMFGVQIVGSSTLQYCMVCYMDPQVVRSQLVSTENAELYEENVQKSMLGTQCMLMSATGIIIDFIFLCVRLQDS